MYLMLVRQGDKYGPEYIKAARKSSNFPVKVLGDREPDIQLSYQWKGWWAKMELFSPELREHRPFLYMDLDSLIMKSIPYIDSEKPIVCREWHPNVEGCGRIQSSLMYLPKDVDYIWEDWILNHDKYIHDMRGDQNFLERFYDNFRFFQDEYPDLIGSYKIHNKEKPIHRIVTFHGKPKPENATGWAQDRWKLLTSS